MLFKVVFGYSPSIVSDVQYVIAGTVREAMTKARKASGAMLDGKDTVLKVELISRTVVE